MAKKQPEYRVTKHDGAKGSDKIAGWSRRSTVSRSTTLSGAQAARQRHRQNQPAGSSDWFTVNPIHRRSR